jgi:hypothetical protein
MQISNLFIYAINISFFRSTMIFFSRIRNVAVMWSGSSACQTGCGLVVQEENYIFFLLLSAGRNFFPHTSLIFCTFPLFNIHFIITRCCVSVWVRLLLLFLLFTDDFSRRIFYFLFIEAKEEMTTTTTTKT